MDQDCPTVKATDRDAPASPLPPGLTEGIAQAERGELIDRGSFAQYATSDGWFSDITDDENPTTKGMWQPFLQDIGCCFPLPLWFTTEAQCDSYIASIPAGALREAARYERLGEVACDQHGLPYAQWNDVEVPFGVVLYRRVTEGEE